MLRRTLTTNKAMQAATSWRLWSGVSSNHGGGLVAGIGSQEPPGPRGGLDNHRVASSESTEFSCLS